MRPARNILVYIAAIFAGAGFLGPLLYWLVQWLGGHFSIFHTLAQNPFHRFVDRSLMVLALVGLWPLLRSLGFKNWRELGLISPNPAAEAWSGFFLGFISLAAAGAITLGGGGLEFRGFASQSQFARVVLSVVGTAVAIGFLEEILFRSGLFGGLRRRHSVLAAVCLSSAIYAMVHFFERPPEPETVQWGSGFVSLARMLRGFGEWQAFWPKFFNLFLAGIILALSFEWSRSLYRSIGLHAGWIFWLKIFAFLTRKAEAKAHWFWGGGKLIDGLPATIALLAVLAYATWRWRTESKENAGEPSRSRMA